MHETPSSVYYCMRAAPQQLYDSELFNTMLLTDYVLKFLTTHQEVQGRYPFEQKPVATMLQHLPQYLRQIIDNFQEQPHSGGIHRFWIEAEEIDVLHSSEERAKDSVQLHLGGMRMRLLRNIEWHEISMEN